MNELIKSEQTTIKVTLKDIKDRLCPKATDQEAFVAFGIIKNCNLDPFKKEVHLVKYGDAPIQIITGYEVYLKRAEESGQLDGWKVEITPDGEKATTTIYRKDWKYPFVWESFKKEFNKKQATWQAMPDFMLKKVCIAQAFRLAFPRELGGMPYTEGEIGVEDFGQNKQLFDEPKVIDAVAEPVPDKAEKIKVLEDIIKPYRENAIAFLQSVNAIKGIDLSTIKAKVIDNVIARPADFEKKVSLFIDSLSVKE